MCALAPPPSSRRACVRPRETSAGAAIPVIRRGGDAVVCSQTGTGKTLAFLLPLLERVARGGVALVVAASGELVEQSAAVARAFGPPAAAPLVLGRGSPGRWTGAAGGGALLLGTPGALQNAVMGASRRPQGGGCVPEGVTMSVFVFEATSDVRRCDTGVGYAGRGLGGAR